MVNATTLKGFQAIGNISPNTDLIRNIIKFGVIGIILFIILYFIVKMLGGFD